MTLLQKFKSDIKSFMRETKMSKTAFGVRAAGNPHAIATWLSGERIPRLDSVDAVYEFMTKIRKGKNVSRS